MRHVLLSTLLVLAALDVGCESDPESGYGQQASAMSNNGPIDPEIDDTEGPPPVTSGLTLRFTTSGLVGGQDLDVQLGPSQPHYFRQSGPFAAIATATGGGAEQVASIRLSGNAIAECIEPRLDTSVLEQRDDAHYTLTPIVQGGMASTLSVSSLLDAEEYPCRAGGTDRQRMRVHYALHVEAISSNGVTQSRYIQLIHVEQLKVMTYNVQGGLVENDPPGPYAPQSQSDLIQKQDPDIILFQEQRRVWDVNSSWQDVYQAYVLAFSGYETIMMESATKGIEWYCAIIHQPECALVDRRQGVAIFSRFPILSHREIRFSDESDMRPNAPHYAPGALEAVIDIGGVPVTVVTTHLSSPTAFRFPAAIGATELDRAAWLTEKQAGEMASAMSSANPVIVGGDFNWGWDGAAMSPLAGLPDTQHYCDGVRGCLGSHKGDIDSIAYTFPTFEAVDGFRVASAPRLSDHDPVVVRLRFARVR